MFRFLEFLREGMAEDRIHRNPSVAALKNLAKTSKYKLVRYVLHKDGTVFAGSSHNFNHEDLSPDKKQWHSFGNIAYLGHKEGHGDRFQYNSIDAGGTFNYHTAKSHPVYERWKKMGMENTRDVDEIREGLTEGFAQEKVHRNPSMATIKALTKNSKYNETRYAIDHHDNLWVGDSEHFIHDSLGEKPTDNSDSHKINGWIKYRLDKQQFGYTAYHRNVENPYLESHPHLDRFNKHGMIRYHP